MKIREIKIENFGKLSDFRMTLSDGINIVLEDNGWGKSTLAAFIKVMFYGFEGDRKRDISENERLMYRPWQSGVFGGSLVFESSGREYRIIRTFGTSLKDDSFAVYDNKTRSISNDFSENIGKELFELDSESFKNTVLIGQNAVETETTDGINAKLGSLSGVTDDISSFEEVAEKFKKKLNSLSPTRVTGRLHELKNRITELKQQEMQLDAVDSSIDSLSGKCREKEEELESVTREIAEKQEALKEASRREKLLAKKEEYEAICRRLDQRAQDKNNAEAAFQGEVPKRSSITSAADNLKELSAMRKEYEKLQFSYEEKEEYDRYSRAYAGAADNTDIIFEVNRLLNEDRTARSKQESIPAKETYLESIRKNAEERNKEAADKSKRKMIALNLLYALDAAAAVILKIYGCSVAAICLAGALVIAFAATIIVRQKVKKNQENRLSESGDEQYASVKKEIDDDIAFIDNANSEIKEFLNRFGRECAAADYANNLVSIKTEYERLLALQSKIDDKRDDILKEKINALRAELITFVTGDDSFTDEMIREKLQQISDRLMVYEGTQKELEKAAYEKTAFESANNMEEIRNADNKGPGVESVSKALDEQTRQKNELEKVILSYQKQLESHLERRDEIGEAHAERKAAEEEYDYLSKRNALITKTKDLLEQAKGSFVAKYCKPVSDGFNKYYNRLETDDKCIYSFDANMNLKIEDAGDYRQLLSYSAGSKDRISLAFRMGLIEAMYREEKPMIIMDDPFVNLDGKSLDGAKEALKAIGGDYQVLYLTCHESRCI